jgi:hypothetical protein
VEQIDSGGEWWLPQDVEKKLSGWLTFTAEAGAQLRLVGSFSNLRDEGIRGANGSLFMTEDSLDAAGSYPRILGQIGSQAVTLEGCFRTNLNRQLFGGLPAETIHVDQIYRGA